LSKQVLKNETYKNCSCCTSSIVSGNGSNSLSQLVNIKTRGGLIHTNIHFFDLIRYVEKCFAENCTFSNVFDVTVDKVLDTYDFTFPCKEHGSEILSYAIFYYLRLRMRQFTFQENQKHKKKSIIYRKISKLSNV